MPAYTARNSRYDLSFGLLAEANQVAGILDGSVGFPSDPKGVHDAWLLLSHDQRAELLAGDPGRFGNLNGIPAGHHRGPSSKAKWTYGNCLMRAHILTPQEADLRPATRDS